MDSKKKNKSWLDFDKKTIFEGKDEKGNRYLSQFLRDYKQVFPKAEINAGCGKCLEDYYTKLINHQAMKKGKPTHGYKLKAKFEGIPLHFGSQVLVTNANLTEAYAKELLKRKNGKNLFSKIPEDPKGSDRSEGLSRLKREELDAKALELGLNPEDYANRDEVIEAIKNFIPEDPKGSDEEE